MRIVTRAEIEAVFDRDAVLDAVRAALVAHARGAVIQPEPLQLLFHESGTLTADCHVKAAARVDAPIFAIKIATGFYANAARGLPVNGGAVVVFNARTGVAEALLDDGGLLTAWRTAAAGALAAALASCQPGDVLAIAGTGYQAELQARWAALHLNLRRVRIWGRRAERAEALAARLGTDGLVAEVAPTVAELCRGARVLITATPATVPIVAAADVVAPLHIVALGADSPGKTELDPALFARAAAILTDDHRQCLAHGEFGHAVRAGAVAEDADRSFGAALADGRSLSAGGITVVDLTGLGAQDLAMAEFVWSRLASAY